MLYVLVNALGEWLHDMGLSVLFGLVNEVQFRALGAAGLAFLIVIVAGRRTIAFLTRMKIGDTGLTDSEALRASARSKANTPTMGGVLIVGAMAISILLLADPASKYTQHALVMLAWLAILGGVDDWLKLTASRRGTGRQGLRAWEKLVFQVGLGLLVGYFAYAAGDVQSVERDLPHVLNLPFQRTYLPRGEGLNPSLIYLTPIAFVAVMVLMTTGLSNAVNITDGMDGLASGISAAVALGLLILTLVAGDQAYAQYLLVPYVNRADELAVVSAAMLGACLGFLWWNCSPAQVFMGDTGALCLGGVIGYVAVVIRQEAVVLIMCGVFLLEIASVVVQVGYFRWSGGKRVFRCAPYHHHLHLVGWTEQQVVARAWIVSVVLVIAGLASLKVR